MADEKDKKEDVIENNLDNDAQNVANLSVPTIITALHQTAISKSDAKSKGARITNSAIEEKDGKGKIKSAGEHIISVLPIDENKPIEKSVAIEILKTYVQWFVGPDLASKVNDSTVKSLTEAPGYEEKKEPEKELSESKRFMSFKQFLNEAENEESSEEPSEESFEDEQKEDENKKKPEEKPAEDKKNDETKQSKIGYYIPYSLKVEGLPQVALKDAMKKFAKTFFDDVTIKASGLFGGGASFTVKDIKKTLRSTFGAIEPDELIQSVQTRLEKLYPNTDRPSVAVQDKTTIISDLGSQIDSAQKKMINTANYSLFIKVNEHDPKKPILNTRTIADIVTSSIKGLFKKFKNKITKNDVIYIKDYKDTHEDAEAIRKIYISVPSPDQLQTIINKAKNANDAYTGIEKLFEKVGKDPQYKNVNRAFKCLQVWENYREAWEKAGDDAKSRSSKTGNNKKEYFDEFQKKYKKVFDATKDKSINSTLNEAINTINSIGINFHKILFEAFFNEAEYTDDKDKSLEIDSKKIKEQIEKIFKTFKIGEDLKIFVGSVEETKNKLKYYEDSVSYDDFKNAVIITSNEETLNEAINDNKIKKSIIDILFEDDKKEKTKEDNEENNQEELEKQFQEKLEKDRKNIYSAITTAFSELDPPINEYANELFIVKMKSLDDIHKKKKIINESFRFLLEDEDVIQIRKKFQTGLEDIVNLKPGKFYTPKNNVSSIDDIKIWLDKIGLTNSDIDKKAEDFSYAASVIVKMPDNEGKHASKGYGILNKSNITAALKDAIKDLDGDIDCIEYEKTANDNFRYNKTKIPAKCQVWIAFFNMKKENNDPNPNPNPDPDPNPNPDPVISKDDTIAFVLPFGTQEIKQPKVKANDIDINDDSTGKYDAYVIPMKGLSYDDPEYENTKI